MQSENIKNMLEYIRSMENRGYCLSLQKGTPNYSTLSLFAINKQNNTMHATHFQCVTIVYTFNR